MVGTLDIPDIQRTSILLIHHHFMPFLEAIAINLAVLLVDLFQFILPLIDGVEWVGDTVGLELSLLVDIVDSEA